MSEQKSIQKFDPNIQNCSKNNDDENNEESSKQQKKQQCFGNKQLGQGGLQAQGSQSHQQQPLGSNLSMEGLSIEDYSKYLTSRTSVVNETESFQDWQKRVIDDREKMIKSLVSEQLKETERRQLMLQKNCPACNCNRQNNQNSHQNNQQQQSQSQSQSQQQQNYQSSNFVQHNNCGKVPNESSESIAAVCNRIRERKIAKSKRMI